MAPSNYPGKLLRKTNSQFSDGNSKSILIDKVVDKLKKLPKQAQIIRSNTKHVFQSTSSYDEFNVITHIFEKRRVIHFQGITRLNNSKYFALSGGDDKLKCSHLFIVSLEAFRQNRPKSKKVLDGPIGSNTNYATDNRPRDIDCLNEIYKLDNGKYWHAGGIACAENILVVPIEYQESKTDYASEIRFIDVSDPSDPKKLPAATTIKRQLKKAGACALIRIPCGKYLCAVWTDSDKIDQGNRKIDFYISKSKDIKEGFEDKSILWGYSLLGQPGKHPKYQSIQFVLQNDGKLFLLGMENSSSTAPIGGSNINRVRAYEISFPGQDILGPSFDLVTPSIKKVYQREFDKGGQYFNFASGCGIYTTPNKNLALYATHHWMKDELISIAEFYPDSEKADKPADLSEAEIVLYEDKNLKGKSLKLYGRIQAHLPKYNRIDFHGKKMDKKISSLRYRIPKGHTYCFYEGENFNSDPEATKTLVIKGTDKWEEIKDLEKHQDFNDIISSSKYL